MPPSECKECTVKLVQTDEVIACHGGCGGLYCLKCSNIKRHELKYLSDNTNLKWFCNECALSNTNTKFIEIKHLIEKNKANIMSSKDIKENVEQIFVQKLNQMKNNMMSELYKLIECNIEGKLNTLKNELISELSKSLQENNDKIKEMCAQNKSTFIESKQKSYAETTKQNNENKIVIIPKDKTRNNKEAKNALKRVVNPTDCLVSGVREINGGGLIVQCIDNKAKEKVQQKISDNIGEDYNLEKSKNKSDFKRRFKVIGMSDNISEQRLIECITKQNDICKDKVFNVVKIYINPNNRQESYSAIIETDGGTYEDILRQRKLNIEWDSCYVFEYVNILRCYKCLGFNHKAINCINRLACSKCAGNHNVKECNSNVLKCVNCCDLVQKNLIKTDVHHDAFSRQCPAYIKHFENKTKIRK